MHLDPDTCYRAITARDARFDGRFFVGVASTGIYCRPICRVRLPLAKNCRYFPSAAAAEAKGFRPCLRCRPELAPGNASVDAAGRLTQAAIELIEQTTGEDGESATLAGIASRLGVSDRHLRRVFEAELGVPPVSYAQTQRCLLARRLITDTTLDMTGIALASGFRSIRRFNAVFRSRYGLAPRDLRRSKRAQTSADALVFELAYRPPYDWAGQLDFLGKRTVSGVETVEQDCYRRSVRIEHGGLLHTGWMQVSAHPAKVVLRATLSASLMRVVRPVLARTRQLMDLNCNPDEVNRVIGALAGDHPGRRVPGAFDGFELAVRAILGQQVTVKAARTLAGRVARAYGDTIVTPWPELDTAFPTAGRLALADVDGIASLGIVASRANAIIEIARAVAAGRLELRPGAALEATSASLQAIRGIGPWTADYIAMRALAWPDAFLPGDVAIRNALGGISARAALEQSEQWRPWRAYALMHLWASLHEPAVKPA